MKQLVLKAVRIFVLLAWPAAASTSSLAAASAQTEDVAATIQQSVVDKVLTSISYPHTAVDGHPGGDWGCLGLKETSQLIAKLNSTRRAEYTGDDVQLARVINEAKEATERFIQDLKSGKPVDGGPSLEELIAMREFWEGKPPSARIELKGGCCLGIEYKVDHLRIDVTQKPNVTLGEGRINIQNVDLYVKASISLRASMPGVCCRECHPIPCLCGFEGCCWTSSSWQLRPSSAVTASAYLQPRQVSVNGKPEIGVFPHINHLYLNWLPIDWGWFVNTYVLKNKSLAEVPLSELGFDISQIKRRVTVSSIRFIDRPNSLPISITVNVGPK